MNSPNIFLVLESSKGSKVIHCGKIVLICLITILSGLSCPSVQSKLEYWRALSIKLRVSQSLQLHSVLYETDPAEALVLHSLCSLCRSACV